LLQSATDSRGKIDIFTSDIFSNAESLIANADVRDIFHYADYVYLYDSGKCLVSGLRTRVGSS